MNKLFKEIPVMFYNEDKAGCPPPRVDTVEQLIKQLERLPKDLALSGWPDRLTHEIVVYNISMPNPHVSINEIDQEY